MDPSQQNNFSQKKQGKKGKGRQKIVIEKIENEANRQVTFSKRRAGLFKKASELSTLCGVESAIVVFSPSNKAHSFGNPNVETIIDKFLNLGRTENTQATSAHNNSITRMRNQELTDLESQLELEKKHKKEQNRMRKENQSQKRNPPNLDELNYKQLKELKKSIIEFKHRFETKVQKATNLAPNSHVDRLIGEGFPVTIPCGPVVGYSLDPNSDQGPNYMVDLYGNASSDPTLFDNAGASNPGATFFPNMETTTNPGFVGPFDQMASDFGGLTFPFPHEASGSNFMFPYNYGIHNDIVPNDNAQGFSGIYYGRGN